MYILLSFSRGRFVICFALSTEGNFKSMNRVGTALIGILIYIGILQHYGCLFYSCDAEVSTYNVDMAFSIDENRIAVNNSFDIVLEVPDSLMSTEGDMNDVSNFDFEFNLSSFKYSNDTTLNFRDFDLTTSTVLVEAEGIENHDSFVTCKLIANEDGRELRLTVTPTIRDTILMV